MEIEFYKELDQVIDELIVNIRSRISSPTLEYAKESGCTVMQLKTSQRKVLGALLVKGDLCVRDLASVAEITCKNIAAPIKELELLGYVVKDSNPEDSRYVIVKLTDKGRKLCETDNEIVYEGYIRVLYDNNFTDGQQVKMLQLFKELNGIFNAAKTQ